MEIELFFNSEEDRKKLAAKLEQQEWVEDYDFIYQHNKIIVYVANGMSHEAESFAIAERYRGRKVVIDA